MEGVVVTSGSAFPLAVRRELFDRICGGVTLSRAAWDLGVSRTAAVSWWGDAGGMRLTSGGAASGLAAPGDREREGGRGHRLSWAERTEIMRGRDRGLSYAEIGRRIGRDKAVVWREVDRNCNADGDYHAGMAHSRAAERAGRPKAFKLADAQLCTQIAEWMDQGWSPKLIAEVLAKSYPGDRLRRVSHETIYQCLYVQTRGHLRADLYKCLSTKRAARKKRDRSDGRGTRYGEAFKISQRPAEVEDRAVPGHWEGDLILGAVGCGAIGTLVERKTRFTLLLHLPDRHDADSVAAAMIEAMQDLPAQLRRSITWDRGSEMGGYRDIQIQLQAPVYFCDPHSPWQRGSNENTNRLLRFWFAKGSDLRVHSKADLQRVQNMLNKRPRPTLNLDTPADRLNALLTEAA
jgi:transposase, IS30 family